MYPAFTVIFDTGSSVFGIFTRCIHSAPAYGTCTFGGGHKSETGQNSMCMLQRVAVCCSVLRRVAVCCSYIPSSSVYIHISFVYSTYIGTRWHRTETDRNSTHLVPCVVVCCSVLQCVAVCCSVVQCVAVWCSVLQCEAATSIVHSSIAHTQGWGGFD